MRFSSCKRREIWASDFVTCKCYCKCSWNALEIGLSHAVDVCQTMSSNIRCVWFVCVCFQSWLWLNQWWWSKSFCRCSLNSTVTSSNIWPNSLTTSRLSCDLNYPFSRLKQTLVLIVCVCASGAHGPSEHPVADRRILRTRPQNRPRRPEKDGQNLQ